MKTVQQKYTKRRLQNHEFAQSINTHPIGFPQMFETTENTQTKNEEISHGDRFEKLLLAAIDESLSSLGGSAKQAIYYHLEKSFKIKKMEIPLKIEEFTIALEEIFGDGAKLLEIQMMKRLHEKTENTFEYSSMKNELMFIDYVHAHETP